MCKHRAQLCQAMLHSLICYFWEFGTIPSDIVYDALFGEVQYVQCNIVTACMHKPDIENRYTNTQRTQRTINNCSLCPLCVWLFVRINVELFDVLLYLIVYVVRYYLKTCLIMHTCKMCARIHDYICLRICLFP